MNHISLPYKTNAMRCNKFTIIITFILLLIFTSCIAEENDYIVVNKKNVTYKFVRFDDPTDHFTSRVFHNWENDTFEAFEKVKNPQNIAIDLGAWIGTTAIWLSKNFHHVVTVDCDKVSLVCLEKNLKASECNNVTICNKAIAATNEEVIFGPKGRTLNESISCIKKEKTHPEDYLARSMTFKQIIHDYVFANPDLNSHAISFIKCDIEGGEEDILEDILHFAYYNNCAVHMSFHTSWWHSKKIRDFEHIFKYFKTDCPSNDICQYIEHHPFAAILFEPVESGILTKKEMPAVIIGYNQLTYIKNMVKQLEKYTSDIIVVDNNSNYAPLLDYYQNEFKHTLLKQKTNFGHTVYNQGFVQKLVGDLYVLTDPDLRFNIHLPDQFLDDLKAVSDWFKASRVGFALCIDSNDIRTDILCHEKTIKAWEKQFWQHKLYYPAHKNMELYSAPIDTTFCLINRRNTDGPHIRVAGNYTCFHLPWHKNFRDFLEPGEYESYLVNNKSTTWFSEKH